MDHLGGNHDDGIGDVSCGVAGVEDMLEGDGDGGEGGVQFGIVFFMEHQASLHGLPGVGVLHEALALEIPEGLEEFQGLGGTAGELRHHPGDFQIGLLVPDFVVGVLGCGGDGVSSGGLSGFPGQEDGEGLLGDFASFQGAPGEGGVRGAVGLGGGGDLHVHGGGEDMEGGGEQAHAVVGGGALL